MTRQGFINLITEKINKIENFPVLKSLAISQACLESAFGRKHFYNNIYGMKCHDPKKYAGCRLAGTKEFVNGSLNNYRLAFQTYHSFDESLEDYVRLMRLNRYKPVRQAKDYKEATEQIRLCKYATSPTYTNSLRRIIEKYQLYKLDTQGSYADKYSHITKNFRYYEVWSGDIRLGEHSIEPPEEIRTYIFACVEQLQFVRDKIGVPIIITSGYRTPEWNKYVGGVKNSYHKKGMAVDTRAVGIPLFIYYSYLLKYTKFNGYGYYRWKNFIHTDLRNDFTIFKY